ncbi:MAG: hypothetical protein HYS60_01130 [Candidatus Wildermuthbacteria bacterium]|nr:hypothetical protein [Candidatus Wildermuthbacteria bacterium]
MSTHGIIACSTETGWCGRYYHWNGTPDVLGRELWKLYHGFFQENLLKMLGVLIDEHPAGWGDFADADWTLKPGFNEAPEESQRPRCLCHGDRSEEEWKIAQDTPNDASYVFVLLGEKGGIPPMMVIYSRELLLFADSREEGFYSRWYDIPKWYEIARISLSGEEPDWEVFERLILKKELRRTWGKIGRATQMHDTAELSYLREREMELKVHLQAEES